MAFKDYIFYRMHHNYKKANEGIFSVVMFLTLFEYFLIAPFIIIFVKKSNISNGENLFFYLTPMLIIFLLNCKRYYRKGKVTELIKKYHKSPYNKSIKNWMIYSLTFFAIAWGLIVGGHLMSIID